MSLTSTEHPFAEFIKILGKGKKGSRDLTQDEAYRAMQTHRCEEQELLRVAVCWGDDVDAQIAVGAAELIAPCRHSDCEAHTGLARACCAEAP